MKIKVNFTDFWDQFDKNDNFFLYILKLSFDVQISEDPDILIYSCYGFDYLKFSCVRIFYTPENIRPDFTACDFAISFDYNNKYKHYRFPLFGIYIDKLNAWNTLKIQNSYTSAKNKWDSKSEFCCMLVSNPFGRERNSFFDFLNRKKRVDSGGKYRNNLGYQVHDKMKFISKYRFVFAFENSSFPGYTTEKILEPLLVDSIPIYWGNPKINEEFNAKRIINIHDFQTYDDVFEKILMIEHDSSLAIKMLMEPIFPGNKVPNSISIDKLLDFLKCIITSAMSNEFKPVAKSRFKYLHELVRRKNMIEFYYKKVTGQRFR